MNEKPERAERRKAMGRGLSSLLGEQGAAPAPSRRRARSIPIEHIQPNGAQPRRTFPEEDMKALAASISEHGILQPILVRRLDGDQERFEIIAGERRWRAAQRARMHEVPALIRESDDQEALEIALIENIQRSDLTPLEEAKGFQCLIDQHGHSQDAIARAVGKSRSHVANTVRLLSLSPGARAYLEDGRLTAGHARALLGASDADGLAGRVVAENLSVRETEQLVQNEARTQGDDQKPRRQQKKDADVLALERSITEALGLSVDITVRDGDRGRLTIHYQSLEQLDGLLARLAGPGRGPNRHAVRQADGFSDAAGQDRARSSQTAGAAADPSDAVGVPAPHSAD